MSVDRNVRYWRRRRAIWLCGVILCLGSVTVSAEWGWLACETARYVDNRAPEPSGYYRTATGDLRGQSARTRLLWRTLAYFAGSVVSAAGLVACFRGIRAAEFGLRRLGPYCRKCSYLLRGLTEPRCPECGTPFEPPRAEG